MKQTEQQFLNSLEKKLWNAADRLRSTLDAAQYKHAVLGLLFIKYVSDAFDIRREELKVQFSNENHGYFFDPDDFESKEEYGEEIMSELEQRDYYTEKMYSGCLLKPAGIFYRTITKARQSLVENALVECMVALPGQLFTNTQIPACIWFLSKDKKNGINKNGKTLRDRSQEILFIDTRNLGYMKDRVLGDFKETDIRKVADTFHQWQKGNGYEDEPGFCKSIEFEEIKKHDFILTPGRYVGAPPEEDDGEPFRLRSFYL